MARARTLILVGVVSMLAFIAGRPAVRAQQAERAKSPDSVSSASSPRGVAIVQGQKYATTMNPNQEVPIPNGTPTGRGTGVVVLNAAENQITVLMTFTSLTSNAIAAHIHGNATSRPGQNAPVLFDLGATPGTSGTNLNTTFAVTPADVALLRSNLCYINVHSVNNPAGEIRGQLHLLELAFDADTDGKTDPAVFRPSDTIWYRQNSTTNTMTAHQWGLATDISVPGDYDGDGQLDPAVWRPTSGTWFIRNSSTGLMRAEQWGSFNDIPAPADYDKDGRTDVAVFRPESGTWYILRSTAGSMAMQFGQALDRPAPADYDGDGRADIAVKRPGSNWWAFTATGNLLTYMLDQGPTPIVPADYTGDGVADVGQFNAATGIWQFLDGTNGSPFMHLWGGPGDIPVAGDYDSDSRTDTGVFRPSEGRWYLRLSHNETLSIVNWGMFDDGPLPSMFTMPSTAPTAVGDVLTVAEDSALTAMDPMSNDTDPDGGARMIWAVTQPLNGSVAITGNGTGVTYQPNGDYCNNPAGTPDMFSYVLRPGGSVGNVAVTVTCVDDNPVAVNDNQTVLEDAGATSLPVLANDTDIDAGPISITSVTQPANGVVAITGGGTGLTYQPNADYCNAPPPSATDTFTYTLSPGGSIGTVSMTVTCVNDAPSFTIAGNPPAANEDGGAQNVPSFATSISPGPGEGGQVVTFIVLNNSSPSLFSTGPAISSGGTLTYTPAANQNGTATIQVKAQDDGGTANGGDDDSDPVNFVITVNAVNDPPVTTNKTAIAQANMQLSIGGLLAGTTDADSGDPGCTPTFTLASAGPGTLPAGGGVVITNAATGTVDFNPPPGVTGPVTFNFTVSDDGCPGSATSAPATVTVTVNGPVIWFVDNSVAGPGDGRLNNPFKTLASADAVDGPGHRVFVYTGTYANGLTLSPSEWLIGQGASAPPTFDALFGITPPATTIPRPSIGGARPVLQGTVTLEANVRVQGINVFPSVGTVAVTDPVAPISSVLVSEINVATTNAAAVTVSDIGGSLFFTAVSSTGGANVGISVVNQTGAFEVTGGPAPGSGGTIANKTGPDGSTTSGIGVYLENATNVALNGMQLNDFDNYAIHGRSVTGLVLTNLVINGVTGTTVGSGDAPIAFGVPNPGGANGLIGTTFIDNIQVSGGIEHNLGFFNQSGLTDLIIQNSAATSNNAVTGTDGIVVVMQGTASGAVFVSGTTFDDNKSRAAQVSVLDNATMSVHFDENTVIRTSQGIEGFVLRNGGNGQLLTHVTDNTISGIGGSAIAVGQVNGDASDTSQLVATITGNNIVQPAGATNRPIAALLSSTIGAISQTALLIDDNDVTATNGSEGILVSTPDLNTSPAFHATVTNNRVVMTDNVNAIRGITVQSTQGSGGFNSAGCFDVRANTVTYPNGTPLGINGIRARQAGTGTAQLERGSQLIILPAPLVLAGNNPASTAEVQGTVTVVENGTCTDVAAPTPSSRRKVARARS